MTPHELFTLRHVVQGCNITSLYVITNGWESPQHGNYKKNTCDAALGGSKINNLSDCSTF